MTKQWPLRTYFIRCQLRIFNSINIGRPYYDIFIAMKLHIRKSEKSDLGFLEHMEKTSFPDFQRSTKQSIANSLDSHFQEVLVVEENKQPSIPIGVLILFKYEKSLRIYSIAILPEYQGKGVGDYLLKHAIKMAHQHKYGRILLEAHNDNDKLINWYKARGFVPLHIIKDYYKEGEDALKMEYVLPSAQLDHKTRNIIVINHPHKWVFEDVNAKIISVREYIGDPLYQSNADFRIFNLCSSYKYQTYGYYVSLLASARGQRVVPSATTIRDFRSLNIIRSVTAEIEELIAKSLAKVKGSSYYLNVYFGQTYIRGFGTLAMKLYQLFEAPLFRVQFIKHENWLIKEIKVLSLNKLPEEEFPYINAFTKKYFDKKRFNKTKLTTYKYDLAILVNPHEKTPPSCARALQHLRTAANKRGIYTEFITKADFDKINEFDALFIRETTSVNDYTYEFSRMAYAEGLVVIDEPWSILKCSNKIYQNEIFKKNKVLTPETTVLTKNIYSKKVLDDINYPIVIKQPDSAFSLGVTKVENKEEAVIALDNLFKKSDMIICQEYLYSDFDWRIGVLDNTPLFACKYYMSIGHWQIYNWKGEEEENSGDFETMPIQDVPEIVVKTALKAAALIGDGLYGVDLKMIDGKVYVIEVNDNPNIDADVEDLVLKEKLYEKIIDSFYRRIENSKNIQRLVSE